MQSDKIISEIQMLRDEEDLVLVAIDGRCGAGKTTLAEKIKSRLSCTVIHMDDFFLRPVQRTPERLAEAGGNVDYERFLDEVLEPIRRHVAFSYRPYDCRTADFDEPVSINTDGLVIVEGAYCCHPKLWDYYKLHIFVDINLKEQLRRITLRNGEDGAKRFEKLWIPLEEKYLKEYSIKEKCELSLFLQEDN